MMDPISKPSCFNKRHVNFEDLPTRRQSFPKNKNKTPPSALTAVSIAANQKNSITMQLLANI